jgi:hypothetical protein
MTEQSFPVIEKPLTDDQWKSVTLGIGDGVLDEGGNPYRITLSNTGDNVTVEVDTLKGFNHAILRGFYHKMDAPITLKVPAVTAETTYYIALQYNPANSETPVKLGVWTNLDFTSGKYYLHVAEIVRKPNQLLTDAKLTMRNQKITPTIQVDRESDLPDPNRLLWGTRAIVWRENKEFRASWNVWSPIGGQRIALWGMPGWSFTSASGGMLVQPTSDGWECKANATVQRAAESYTIRDWSVVGTLMGDSWFPTYNLFGVGVYRDQPIQIQLDKAGRVQIKPMGGASLNITQGYSFTFDFTWFAPMDPNTAS